MTARPDVKRALRRVTKMDDAQLSRYLAEAASVRNPEPATMASDVEHAISQLDQQIHAAAPEDRIEVLRIEGYEAFEHFLGQGMSDEEARASLCGFADRHHLWGGGDRIHEAEIIEVIREISDVCKFDAVPFEEDVDMPKPLNGTSVDQRPGRPALPPLTLSEWDARDLPSPDSLLGSVVSTTNRMLISAETGIGKTNLAIAIGLRIAAGDRFLHWDGSGKPRKVLYLDGEMSRRLLRLRLRSEAQRLGSTPATFFALCAEDIDDFKPLNTQEGRSYLKDVIKKLGGVDLVIFDNIMSLISGSMIDEIPWAEVMPFVRSLTRRNTGQIWIHHTGHNEMRSYGTKTREWQMDTVAILEQVKRPGTDVSFKMSFGKARERAPSNRCDFQDVEIALVDDAWVYTTEPSADAFERKKISPTACSSTAATLRKCGSDWRGEKCGSYQQSDPLAFHYALLWRVTKSTDPRARLVV